MTFSFCKFVRSLPNISLPPPPFFFFLQTNKLPSTRADLSELVVSWTRDRVRLERMTSGSCNLLLTPFRDKRCSKPERTKNDKHFKALEAYRLILEQLRFSKEQVAEIILKSGQIWEEKKNKIPPSKNKKHDNQGGKQPRQADRNRPRIIWSQMMERGGGGCCWFTWGELPVWRPQW